MFKTLTGYTFVFIGNERIKDEIIDEVYKEFIMYVLRNPAYFDDMPINLPHFKPQLFFEKT